MVDLRASDEVLMAAASLSGGSSATEFTEWQLTIATWQVNKQRWGLRGFETLHPDHKRVMMEVMGKGSIITQGWLERPRPNHYRITSAGLSRAASVTAPRDTRTRTIHIYDAVHKYAFHRVFEQHLEDSAQPKTWLGAAAFLGLSTHDPDELEKGLKQVRSAIAEASQFMRETGTDRLLRGDRPPAVTPDRLNRLSAFLSTLETRFASHLAAIRRKGGASPPR